MLPVGFSVAASTRVGNFLGANDPQSARKSAIISVIGAACLCVTVSFVLFNTDHTIVPSIFSDDSKVIHSAARTIPLLAVYVLGDGVQVALSGVIKGCGRQCIASPVVIFSYWIVALPIAYYLSFIMEEGMECNDGFCGVVGLTTGMTVGTWVHCLLILVIVCCTNWQKEADRALTIIKENNENSVNVSYFAVSSDDAADQADVENAKFQMEQDQKDDDFFAGLEMRNLNYVDDSGGDVGGDGKKGEGEPGEERLRREEEERFRIEMEANEEDDVEDARARLQIDDDDE